MVESDASRHIEARTGAELNHIGDVTEMVAPTVKAARLQLRSDKGLRFVEALDDTVRKHRAVFAGLAESERQVCAAEVRNAIIRRGL